MNEELRSCRINAAGGAESPERAASERPSLRGEGGWAGRSGALTA
jgi:hypothetical protein